MRTTCLGADARGIITPRVVSVPADQYVRHTHKGCVRLSDPETRNAHFVPNLVGLGEFVSSLQSGLLPTKKMLPSRYSIKEGESGRFLTCVEAPNISVSVERGFTVSASGARKYPEHTMFLDGAAQGKPFIDVGRKVYNLDHHEGCVRPFTLATCEQAMVLVLKGLDLRVGDWRVYGNEPDLDTVLAIWVILNHMRLTGEDDEIRYKIAPLVRLQGLIDTHGLELRDFSGFSHQRQRTTLDQIEQLRNSELELKKEGLWQTADFLEYTATVLRTIDELVYSARHFDDLKVIEELARIPISADRIAVICASEEGIYEVEAQMRKIHGDRIGLIILQKDKETYTLRQTDSFLPVALDRLYERLNTLDPRVKHHSRWGGSTDIGGSPRGVGTGLTHQEIALICRWVFQPADQATRLQSLGLAAAWTLITVILTTLPSIISRWQGGNLEGWLLSPPGAAWESVVVFFSIAVLCVAWVIKRGPRCFAHLKMAGWGWLMFLPLCCGALALTMGALVDGSVAEVSRPMTLLNLVAAAMAFEVLFRGAMFGFLSQLYRIMRPGGPWFLSVPLLTSSALSGWVAVTLYRPPNLLITEITLLPGYIIWVVSVFGLALILGIVRERWRSLLAPVLLHCLAAMAVAILAIPLVS